MKIDLGIPRLKFCMVTYGEGDRVIKPEGGRDLNEDMNRLSKEFLDMIPLVDGFIIEVLLQAIGYFELILSPVETEFFLASIERYVQWEGLNLRTKRTLLHSVLREKAINFSGPGLFCPFPENLNGPNPDGPISGALSMGRTGLRKENPHRICWWHHQEVSALPVCRQDVNQWIERSFGDLVGH